MENIVEEFETMFICRYPDSMKNFVFRESKKLIQIKTPTIPWLTGIITFHIFIYFYFLLLQL